MRALAWIPVLIPAACVAPELPPSGPDLGSYLKPLSAEDERLPAPVKLNRAATLIEARETPGSLERAVALLRSLPADPVTHGLLAEAHSRACEGLNLKEAGDRESHRMHRTAGLWHAGEHLKAVPDSGPGWYWSGALKLHVSDAELSLGKAKEALSDLLKAFKSVPGIDHGGPARLMARVYAEAPPLLLGSKPKALEYYRKSLDLAPDFIQTHLWLGECYLQMKDAARARLHLERALELKARQGHEQEDGRYRETAREHLSTLKP
jgi:tetratricopeptide (TPR) repeat protein